MEKPALELVLQVLDALYRNEDASEKEKASSWLMKLQASVHAWEVADQLLLLKRDTETSYFGAQTMQTKIRLSFDELPPKTHLALRDSLLHHLKELSGASAPIVRQLAMALADLGLQMTGWNDVVVDVMNRFGRDISTISVLLDILIILPEEIGNRTLRLGSNRREEWKVILGQYCGLVLDMLANCLSTLPDSQAHAEIHVRVFACLGSWVQLGNFPADKLAQSDLLKAPFQTMHMLASTKLHEAATDCICSLLYVCEDASKYGALPLTMKNYVDQLKPVFLAAVEAEDSDMAYCLCRIFTEMAESFLYYTVHQPNTELGDLQIYCNLLMCVGHSDYEVADITFNVWYRLSEELFKLNDESTVVLFSPYVHQLILGLSKHCQLEEDTPPTIVPEKDDFSEFRNSVVELLRDVIYLVGSLSVFSELYAIIVKPGTSWSMKEACLFVMHAVAPSIRSDESQVLPIAVPVLLSIPPDEHYAIRATTLRLMAELVDWIDLHPDLLDQVLMFLLQGLKIPAVATYAAKAVQNVCQKCRNRMAPHFHLLLQIIQAADNLRLSNDAIVGLLKGAAEVVSIMPLEEITPGIRSLCQLQAVPLHEIARRTQGYQSGSPSDPTLWLDRLTAVFRSCVLEVKDGSVHPCEQVVQELWPVISDICVRFKHDQKVIERACRCLRFMIRCVKKSAFILLEPVITLAVSIYRDHHHSCFLYLGSIIVDEFGSEPTCLQGLLQMLHMFTELTLPLLSGEGGLVNHPDTVDDLFRLCYRFLQKNPLTFLSSPVANMVLQCALAACTLHHRDAFASVMKFIKDLVHCPSDAEQGTEEHQLRLHAVQSILAQNGQLLMNGLVTGFVHLPSYMQAESTEVLWELLLFGREPMCQMLTAAVDAIPSSGTINVSPDQKAEFVRDVRKCVEQTSLPSIVKNFSKLYR